MARQPSAQALADRIEALPSTERVKILAQVMIAEGERVEWADIQRIQRKIPRAADGELDTLVGKAVREVRRERKRRVGRG